MSNKMSIQQLFRPDVVAMQAYHVADAAGFMGDDVMDLGVMAHGGFAAAPANAHDSVLQRAHLVTRRNGGHGAVREVCDFILAAQGRLDDMILPWLPQ